ncbi:hypothetical protein [Granulibacter bethesdensis]|nr:hypothetical protein [Granulibacter bethesdensis]APH61194.1 Hypothetical protein GbCGDNIH8_8411 [Granulibacter bethesdensis]
MITRQSFQVFPLLAATMIGLAACTGPGATGGETYEDKFSQSYIQSHLFKGKTTMRDVQALYGQPFRRSTQGGDRVYWTYRREQTGSMGMLTGIARVVPGVGMSNALIRVNENLAQMQRASDAASGNTEVRGDSLDLVFQNGVLDNWSM